MRSVHEKIVEAMLCQQRRKQDYDTPIPCFIKQPQVAFQTSIYKIRPQESTVAANRPMIVRTPSPINICIACDMNEGDARKCVAIIYCVFEMLWYLFNSNLMCYCGFMHNLVNRMEKLWSSNIKQCRAPAVYNIK